MALPFLSSRTNSAKPTTIKQRTAPTIPQQNRRRIRHQDTPHASRHDSPVSARPLRHHRMQQAHKNRHGNNLHADPGHLPHVSARQQKRRSPSYGPHHKPVSPSTAAYRRTFKSSSTTTPDSPNHSQHHTSEYASHAYRPARAPTRSAQHTGRARQRTRKPSHHHLAGKRKNHPPHTREKTPPQERETHHDRQRHRLRQARRRRR